MLMSVLFASTTTFDPIAGLLNCEDEKKQDELTQRWKDNKLQELNFVGVVGALLAGVLTSTGSWPSVLPNGTRSPWTVRACWYCGIILALGSVLTALQQSIRLHRLSCHEYANKSIRRLLRNKHRDRNGKWSPRLLQVFTWQMSASLLTSSTVAMLAGMFILIWSSTGHSAADETWWNGDAMMAVSFTVVAVFVAGVFLLQQFTLYTFAGEDDSRSSSAE